MLPARCRERQALQNGLLQQAKEARNAASNAQNVNFQISGQPRGAFKGCPRGCSTSAPSHQELSPGWDQENQGGAAGAQLGNLLQVREMLGVTAISRALPWLPAPAVSPRTGESAGKGTDTETPTAASVLDC